MHTSTRAAAALILTTLVLAAAPGSAVPGDCRPLNELTPDVSLCERESFATPIGGRLGNLQGISWTDTAPTGDISEASVTANLVPGSSFVDHNDPRFRPTFDGQYTGTLDTIEVNAYITDPVEEAAGGALSMRAQLTIDGVVLYDNTADGVDVSLAPSSVDENISIASFAFTDVYRAMAAYGLDNAADTEHQIKISWSDQFYGDGNSVVYYDSADTPTNLYFNRLKKSPATKIDIF